ncbi:MAG: acetyl-CoA C-acetyltransferase [Pseudobdellovibrio sp.]
MIRNVYIIGGVRTPFVKSFTSYSKISTQKLMEISLNELVIKYNLKGQFVGDVALGALMTSSKNWNLARECVLSSGLHPSTPAYNVQRACGTSYETAYQIYSKIALGFIETGIAGGVDTNSDAPVEVNEELRQFLLKIQKSKSVRDKIKNILSASISKFGLSVPAVIEPRTGLSMGQHAELMVKHWNISQKEQDFIAWRSHQNAVKAYRNGFYADLVVPVNNVYQDSFIREDTTLEKLSLLKPVFDTSDGTITAGNASPLSDGSSAVLLTSEMGAQQLGLRPQAKFIDFQVSAVDFVGGDGLLMAPTIAVAKLLKRQNMRLQDFDYYEIHEAFAGQVACTLKAWESDDYCQKTLDLPSSLGSIDQNKLNIVGGSLALGHPFAATGGRILASLAKILAGSNKKALISICTAGGMGIAGIIEGV